MSIEPIWLLQFDGSCNPRVGSGAGVVLDNLAGERYYIQKDLGYELTCNQAEYAALRCGLETAIRLGIKKVRVLGDSKLVCRQVAEEWRVKAVNLQTFHSQVLKLKEQFEYFSIEHVSRVKNTLADCLAKSACMGEA